MESHFGILERGQREDRERTERTERGRRGQRALVYQSSALLCWFVTLQCCCHDKVSQLGWTNTTRPADHVINTSHSAQIGLSVSHVLLTAATLLITIKFFQEFQMSSRLTGINIHFPSENFFVKSDPFYLRGKTRITKYSGKLFLIISRASYASVLTILSFSLERYLAICSPLYVFPMSDIRRAGLVSSLCWTIAILASIPHLLFTK